MSKRPQDAQLHQSGMDRVITSKYPRWLKPLGIVLASVVALAILLQLRPDTRRTLRVSPELLKFSRVSSGIFEDYVPIRGRIAPLHVVYLDAIEGGRVDEVLIEEGAIVAEGELLVRLSNTRLQLDVISREAEVTEQINNLNNLELALEQNRFMHKMGLVDINYNLKRLNQEVTRKQKLFDTGYISEYDLEQLITEQNYWQHRKQVSLESQANDEHIRKAQQIQLKQSVEQLRRNLSFAHGNLENLNIRAPISGLLSDLGVEMGQSFTRGERMGQIDDQQQLKVTAMIDEFYLNRINIGQEAAVTLNNENHKLAIKKIYPRVTNGEFEVELIFSGQQPASMKRGQTLQLKLSLGDTAQALLIANGAFYQDTGGNWVFVVSPEGTALRRAVRLGRRNAQFIEVLSGLEADDEVVTSSYSNYLEIDKLELGTVAPDEQ